MERAPSTRAPDAFVPDPAAVAALRSSRPPGHGPVAAYDWIAHHRAHRPAKEAVREVSPPRSLSYAELDARADALAAHLDSLGIGRGDRVALLAHNGVEYFDLQFACGRSGSRSCPAPSSCACRKPPHPVGNGNGIGTVRA